MESQKQNNKHRKKNPPIKKINIKRSLSLHYYVWCHCEFIKNKHNTEQKWHSRKGNQGKPFLEQIWPERLPGQTSCCEENWIQSVVKNVVSSKTSTLLICRMSCLQSSIVVGNTGYFHRDSWTNDCLRSKAVMNVLQQDNGHSLQGNIQPSCWGMSGMVMRKSPLAFNEFSEEKLAKNPEGRSKRRISSQGTFIWRARW